MTSTVLTTSKPQPENAATKPGDWSHLPPQHQRALVGIAELSADAVENHARTLKTDPVHFAAARAFYRWPIGQEMTVEEYDEAVKHVLQQRHG